MLTLLYQHCVGPKQIALLCFLTHHLTSGIVHAPRCMQQVSSTEETHDGFDLLITFGTGEVWTFWVTETKEDQQMLIDAFRDRQNGPYRPNVACFEGNAKAPIAHPRGDARQFSRCAE